MQKKIQNETTNLPELKFSAGPIKATVWKNQVKSEDGHENEYSTITVERVYKDKDGNWHTTNTFRMSDVPKAKALLEKVYETILVKEVA